MNKQIVLFLSTFFMIAASFSQTLQYERSSDYFFGLNFGGTTHTSDVISEVGGGAGFIFGRSFNHDYGRVFSYDLRLRYLTGNWYGQDELPIDVTAENAALSAVYDDVAIQNFQSRQNTGALELAIHLNWLKERTRLDPYIFGGIGITGTRTMGDLLNSFGEPYDYVNGLNFMGTNSKFESPLDKNANGDPYPTSGNGYDVNVLPSLGFGLGYYLNHRLAIGFEHKTTYFNSDYFDGTVTNQLGQVNGNNDRFHYTNFFIRWHLRAARGSGRTTTTHTPTPLPPAPTPDVHTYTGTPQTNQPPVVVFTNPSNSPHTTTNPVVTLRADVRHVKNSQNITFRQEGVEKHDFTFNAMTTKFQSTVNLKPGTNVFRLRGTNEHGVDEAVMIINYQLESFVPTPPTVQITDPSSNPHITSQQERLVRARITNVSNKQQVSYEINGVLMPADFDFNATAIHAFSKSILLNEGQNIVRVIANNQHGSASDQVTIIYNPKEQPKVDPPVVEFTDPNHNITVSDPNIRLNGTVLNVAGKSNVSFVQNGSKNNNFSYSTSSKVFSSNVVLNPGPNMFQLIGTNEAGTDQKSIIITYDVPSPKPPVVNIVNPPLSPFITQNDNFNLRATVLNVSLKSQVAMTVNGVNYSNFSFNPATVTLLASLSLQEGNNIIVITGTNNDGTDSKSTVIVYKKPQTEQPPLVDFINPSSNPFTLEEDNTQVLASVQNVAQKSQISVLVNGQARNDFNFDGNSKTVSFATPLNLGANLVTITAYNNVGTDSKSTTIIYKKPAEQHPPVVTYIDPLQNPITVYSSSYLVKARVQHVKGSQDIQLRINGNITTNFSYNGGAELMTFTTSLLTGANIIEIKATNEFGQDTETTTIIYEKPDPVYPPVVTISTPMQSTYNVSTSSTPIVATVLNVPSAANISVQVNGNMVNDFNFHNTTKVLQFSMNLNEGENTLVISAYNDAGSAADERMIIYTKDEPVEPPYVSFTQPSSPGTVVGVPTYQMISNVQNVERKDDIVVSFNGETVNPARYSFNTITKEVKLSVDLTEGNNYFLVKGSNVAGSHSASTNITYRLPEPDCEVPTVTFIQPDQNKEVEEGSVMVEALVQHVVDASQITLLLNGTPVGNFSYATESNILKRKITDLKEGNNILEIIAQTDCGRVDVTRLVTYKPVTVPCYNPIISLVQPAANYVTQESKVSVLASVSHIDNMQQLAVYVNDVAVNVDYDLGTHTITTQVNLEVGVNKVAVEGTNECGGAVQVWTIKREACLAPTINVSAIPESASTDQEVLTLSGTISDVTTYEILLKQNGTSINFNYNASTQSFSANITLTEGDNLIELSAVNSCGDAQHQVKVNYTPVVVVNPPTVNITNPASSPYETNQGTYEVVAKVTNITSASQISVSVNGSTRDFNFNASNGVLKFVQTLIEGDNNVMIVAVNESGSAEDQAVIVYRKPVVIQPPVVTFTNPTTPTGEYVDGTYNVTGKVTNLESVNQLSLQVNGINHQDYEAVAISDGTVEFALRIAINATHPAYTIKAIGTNSAGSDSKTVQMNRLVEEEDTPNCLPEVDADFGDDPTDVDVSSDKDLSNVVLLFSDNQRQKFEGLSGKTGTFKGTGAHVGKCIIGVWIKSGCNMSNDGPGYGEFVPNPNYDGRCEQAPCTPPTIQLLSAKAVTAQSYSLEVKVDEVNANDVGITHNGQSINCSFNSATNRFSCNVNLTEGKNTFIITANGCETVTEVVEVIYTIPCNPLTYNLVYPSTTNYTTEEGTITVNFTTQHVVSSGITATLNGSAVNAVLSGNSVILSQLNLNEGTNNLSISLRNSCSDKQVNFTITYTPNKACGPRINPGNSDWQFCLVTPSGTFNRSDLMNNKDFTYVGPASSLYFLPIAGGGNATVNGKDYEIKNGNYYLFEGNIQVNVSSKHPGSMGHWQVCITTDRQPVFGNGNNRPASPCEGTGTGNGKSGQKGAGQNNTGSRTSNPTGSTRQRVTIPTPTQQQNRTTGSPTDVNTAPAENRTQQRSPQQNRERISTPTQERTARPSQQTRQPEPKPTEKDTNTRTRPAANEESGRQPGTISRPPTRRD